MERDATLGRILGHLHRRWQIYITRSLKQYDVGSGQHNLIAIVCSHPGISQEEVGSFAGIDKGTTAKMLCSLEHKGYIRRENDERDKRVRLVYPTELSTPIYQDILRYRKCWQQTLTDKMTDQEIETLRNLLFHMVDNVNDFESGIN